MCDYAIIGRVSGQERSRAARYAFAARLARGKRVLDAGGAPGAGQIAKAAWRVFTLDAGAEPAPRLDPLRADCRRLPFPDHSFDLVVAFDGWPEWLGEARRVLRPTGECIVAAPNRLRSAAGMEYDEFCRSLAAHFSHVSVYLENRSEGVISSLPEVTEIETFVEAGATNPAAADFFVAVCAAHPLLASPPFLYLPVSENVLRERERHIAFLQSELEQKDAWLQEATDHLAKLQSAHQQLELEAAADRRRAQGALDALEHDNVLKTTWARQLEAELDGLKAVIEKLQAELEERTAWALQLDAEREEMAANYKRLEQDAAKCMSDLGACVEQLHRTEGDLEERTRWALSLDQQVRQLNGQVRQLTDDLNLLFGSPAYRIGKRLGLAPVPQSDPRRRR